MELSKEEAIRKHREMWNWIAEQYENGATVPVYRLKQDFIKKILSIRQSQFGLLLLHVR